MTQGGFKVPEVWFAIPSANVDLCRENLPAWRERGYKIAVLQNRERGEIPADITAWSDEWHGWPWAVNLLSASIVPSSADIMVTGGDDMLPEPKYMAAELGRQFLERFPDGFGVMQPTGDQFLGAGTYCGSPWMGRAWRERAYGARGPMPEGYRHNWADNELYWVARGVKREGASCLWERPDLTQRHEHFTRTGQMKPGYWAENVEPHDRADVERFIARAWLGFPGSDAAPDSSEQVARFDAAEFARVNPRLAETYWVTRFGQALAGDEAARRMREALEDCSRKGWARVAIFGAGSHTRSLGNVLMRPPVDIVGIVDEDPGMRGKSLWNYPILSLQDAADRRPHAIVLSSRHREAELMKAVEALGPAMRSIAVVRLYGGDVSVAA